MARTSAPASQTPSIPQQQSGKVANLDREGIPAGCRPIAGMKAGWYYREGDRTILHRQGKDGPALPIGLVPEIVAQITHLTDDGEDIRTEYLARGKRQRRPRILTEDELDRGTWAAKMGARRPTGSDERHAFARLIREEGDKAPVTSARTYYNDVGDLIFPDADAQTLGYRVLRGDETAARDAWDEIGAWMTMDGKSALVAGAYFAGPVLDTLDMLAHMVSVHGPGQQGKSTILVVCAACYGDIKPRRQALMTTWNSSKQGITQSLRQRGYLPLALDEHSSSGRTIKESSREISQMVAGAIRAMGTADGSPRESDGFWHSVILSSSNEPLKHEGQTEDLASRLQEFRAPFFPNAMVDAEGAPAEPGHRGAEHISKRLKRLAKDHGGWPVEWAVRLGMYRAENLARLRKLHLELCAQYRPAQGGIAATIAELHMAWVVGAHMLGAALGIPGLGSVAEAEAAARLAEAIEISAEANIPDSERLWNALDALRIEAAAFPEMENLLSVAEEGYRKPRGFTRTDKGEWWVIDPVVRQAAAEVGIDNVTAALRHLDELGVHVRGDGKNAQRLLPQSIRGKLGRRMHCFNTDKAAANFSPDGTPEDGSGPEFPNGPTPRTDPGPTGVGPENKPLTCDGPTGPTGPTLSLFDFKEETGPTPQTDPTMPTTAGVPPMPSEAPTVPYPAPVTAVTDTVFANLVAKANGRTASAVRFGVLGADGLHLPNCAPVQVPLPGSVDDVPALMTAYKLKTLWVHESAALAMGLPDYDARKGLRVLARDTQAETGVPQTTVGPQTPVEHPWATRSGASPITQMAPEGLSTWMTLVLGEGEKASRLHLSLPMYDSRIDKAGQDGRGGFGGAPDAATLLDALMVWTLSTVHGPADRPRVVPYYMSVNRTGEDCAGGRGRTDVACEAVRQRQVTPAYGNTVPLMVPQQWHRPWPDVTEAERTATMVHQYDKTAAWLAAFGNVKLGVGEPTHAHEEDGVEYDKRFAGYWRVAEVPGKGIEGLPELKFRPATGGGYWITTPSMDLLHELYPGWTPRVLEAWYWETSKRALEGMYKLLSKGRNFIVGPASGRPGAKWAKQVNGRVYQSFRGYLARATGPQRDHTGDGFYAADIYYRPDWAQMIIAHATANMYRNLKSFAADGHRPLSVYVDAVAFASNETDPTAAKPASMRLGTEGGAWGLEGSAPMAELLPALENGASAHTALDDYLTTAKGE